ncbi:hypothetical protein PMAYCL1PPCAC_12273, partial [Pristionchus mayeri]
LASSSMFPSSSPIACTPRDVETGLLYSSPNGSSGTTLLSCTPHTILDGVAVTPVTSASPPHSEPQSRNIYVRSHSTVQTVHAQKKPGFMDNLKKRTRQRSINIPMTPDVDPFEDIGSPPISHDPPPEVYGQLARSAPDGGFLSSFRSRSKSEAQPFSGGMITPRRQSGVLVFFPQSTTKSSTDDVRTPSTSSIPLSMLHSPPPSGGMQINPILAAASQMTPTSRRMIPRLGSDRETRSFEGHLPGVNSLFSSSSSSNSSTSSDAQSMQNATASSAQNAYTRSSPRRPLYVDTSLANEQTAGGEKCRASPLSGSISQMVDAVGRRIRTSSLTSPSAGYGSQARASFSMENNVFSPRSPSVRNAVVTGGGRPPQYRYSRVGQQHSLDSGLDLSSPVAGTALLIKDTAFFGSSSASFETMMLGGAEISTVVLDNQDSIYSLFMKAHKCYDLIPLSTKLVVFDTHLPVRKAFFALVYNGVRAAPLWDAEKQTFVGMLTITDFIKILYRHHSAGDDAEKMAALEEEQIEAWREKFKEDSTLRPLVCIDPNESLYRAVEMLCESHVHRLPVMERSTGNISYILTHKRIIKFLSLYMHDLPKPAFMDETPKSLGIGSWGDVLTIHVDTPLIEALQIFLQNRVSALPLVDEEGRAVDIYAKFDVISLAADKAYDKLDITVHEALKHRQEWFEGVRTCKETDSLFSVLESIVRAEVHRLIVTDENEKVTGIISLSDILKYLVLDRCAPVSSSSLTMERVDEQMNDSSPSPLPSSEMVIDTPVFELPEEEISQ